MIKINLTPQVEKDSQFWWVPDVVALAASAFIAFSLVNYFVEDYQLEIAKYQTENENVQNQIAALEPIVSEFQNLEGDINRLNLKISAISNITNSEESRHKIVIVMEHLQHLRPQGVWYQSLNIGDSPPGEVELVGYAFDNALVAELMSAIKATYLIQWDERDLRSHITFNFIDIKETVLTESTGIFKDVGEAYQFKLNFKYEIRENGVAVSAINIENNPNMGGGPGNSLQDLNQPNLGAPESVQAPEQGQ